MSANSLSNLPIRAGSLPWASSLILVPIAFALVGCAESPAQERRAKAQMQSSETAATPLSTATTRTTRISPLPAFQEAVSHANRGISAQTVSRMGTDSHSVTASVGMPDAPHPAPGADVVERASIGTDWNAMPLVPANWQQSMVQEDRGENLPSMVQGIMPPQILNLVPARELALTNEVEDVGEVAPLERRIEFPPLSSNAGSIELTQTADLISLKARDASLATLLAMIADRSHLNLISSGFGDERINVTLENVPLQAVLELLLPLHGYTYTVQNDILIVSSLAMSKSADPRLQGLQLRVYELNYVSGTEILHVVEKMLSPLGQAFINEAVPDNTRKTHEQLVIEDLPASLQRIEGYLQQADTPPRQVQVEAHILQVVLHDDCRHGVDFDQLLRVSNSELSLRASGFTTSGGPATTFRIDGTDLTSLVDLLKSTTDAKTLASPKVTVLNGQQSRMQVGGQIGYLLTTTTQTASLQSVGFLEFGVILTVTPIITDTGQILMQVKPQVSTGRINQTTRLPESETTEVETCVMLNDGQAMVLGGLIKETDTETQNKLPILGDLWIVGRLFQRRSMLRERNEVIITLLPRIVPICGYPTEVEAVQTQRADTPLLDGPLQPVDRRNWEPKLPDAMTRRR